MHHRHEPVALLIHPTSGDVIGRCYGPSASGACPLVELGTTVPCAGGVLEPRTMHPMVICRLHVATGARRCPLSWLANG